MESQIFWYGAVAVIAFFYIRRLLRMRAFKQYSPAEIESRMKSNDGLVLLDVRTDAERQTGALKGSIHIPLASLRSRMDELGKHRNREIVCYCASGSRSASAALLLKKHGFTAGNLRGGMGEWNFAHR